MDNKSNPRIAQQLYVATNRINRINEHYDGDHDIMPGAPRVFWADEQLAEAVAALVEVINLQQAQINTLLATIANREA